MIILEYNHEIFRTLSIHISMTGQNSAVPFISGPFISRTFCIPDLLYPRHNAARHFAKGHFVAGDFSAGHFMSGPFVSIPSCQHLNILYCLEIFFKHIVHVYTLHETKRCVQIVYFWNKIIYSLDLL